MSPKVNPQENRSTGSSSDGPKEQDRLLRDCQPFLVWTDEEGRTHAENLYETDRDIESGTVKVGGYDAEDVNASKPMMVELRTKDIDPDMLEGKNSRPDLIEFFSDQGEPSNCTNKEAVLKFDGTRLEQQESVVLHKGGEAQEVNILMANARWPNTVAKDAEVAERLRVGVGFPTTTEGEDKPDEFNLFHPNQMVAVGEDQLEASELSGLTQYVQSLPRDNDADNPNEDKQAMFLIQAYDENGEVLEGDAVVDKNWENVGDPDNPEYERLSPQEVVESLVEKIEDGSDPMVNLPDEAEGYFIMPGERYPFTTYGDLSDLEQQAFMTELDDGAKCYVSSPLVIRTDPDGWVNDVNNAFYRHPEYYLTDQAGEENLPDDNLGYLDDRWNARQDVDSAPGADTSNQPRQSQQSQQTAPQQAPASGQNGQSEPQQNEPDASEEAPDRQNPFQDVSESP